MTLKKKGFKIIRIKISFPIDLLISVFKRHSVHVVTDRQLHSKPWVDNKTKELAVDKASDVGVAAAKKISKFEDMGV